MRKSDQSSSVKSRMGTKEARVGKKSRSCGARASAHRLCVPKEAVLHSVRAKTNACSECDVRVRSKNSKTVLHSMP